MNNQAQTLATRLMALHDRHYPECTGGCPADVYAQALRAAVNPAERQEATARVEREIAQIISYHGK